MRWHAKWGKDRATLEAAAEQMGRTPKALQNEPELDIFLMPFWSAFWTCAASRNVGFGAVMRIPVSEIQSYCAGVGIYDPDEFLEMVRMIGAMDTAYLEEIEKQKPAQTGAAKPAPGGGKRAV